MMRLCGPLPASLPLISRSRVVNRGLSLSLSTATAPWFGPRLLRWKLGSTAGPEAVDTGAADPAAAAFSELLLGGGGGGVSLRQSAHRGRGLYASESAPAAGAILLSVPLETCLVVDYERGMKLPPAAWPRLRKGAARDDAPLPWDLLHALALLDALAGDGDAFWARYANDVLPGPMDLSLPMCLPEALLRQLGHQGVLRAALAQKERLRALFPGMAAPMCEDGPSYMQWALACVRSRAFQLSPDCFAFVPFLDAANHAAQPNANFRLSPDGRAVELVSLGAVEVTAEVTISYTGEAGYTNQRLMQQYGFVPLSGNPADRWARPGDGGGGGGGGDAKGAAPPPATPPMLLSLDQLQRALGDGEEMVAAFGGRDPFTFAAIKSLPVAAMNSDAAPLEAQLRLAGQLLHEAEAEADQWTSSVAEDEAALAAAADAAGAGDPRLPAVLRYRLQRKRLVGAVARVLRAFLHV